MDSPVEILIVVALALLLFGPSRITSLARSLGEAMKEFKIGSDDTSSPRPAAPAPAADAAVGPEGDEIADVDPDAADPIVIDDPIVIEGRSVIDDPMIIDEPMIIDDPMVIEGRSVIDDAMVIDGGLGDEDPGSGVSDRSDDPTEIVDHRVDPTHTI